MDAAAMHEPENQDHVIGCQVCLKATTGIDCLSCAVGIGLLRKTTAERPSVAST
jgi:hypothetical protein